MPELLQATLLTLAASAGVIRLGIARRAYGEPYQPALFCVQLAFALAAGTGACAVAQLAFGFDTLEARRWLLQATLLLGFPLIGTVALTLARRWTWSRPGWGRMVLGLCAFFELARQLGWSEPYALGLGLGSAALVLYAGLMQWPARLPTGAGMLGCVLMLATLPWPTLSLANYQLLCLGLACLPLAWLLPNLRNNSNERVETSA
ncbi:hypothetical protein [Stutzerimonas nitrititolerans]|uniref:hypothetical protein n=1 Tax=Stutzerimonas nitrititolerans TaxID=2482751 RepID=UPI0028AC09FB|nr:hypothetical protein [Stutzerimonas nitrititolerans]